MEKSSEKDNNISNMKTEEEKTTSLTQKKEEDKKEEEEEEEEDVIIISKSVEEMAKLFINDYMIVWHDPKVKLEENKTHLRTLQTLCQVKTFTDWKEASKFIKETDIFCNVITSGTNGELLVEQIKSLQNVSSIYVFCFSLDDHKDWVKKYSQISV